MARRDTEDGLLARWSRRKQAARQGQLEPEPTELPEAAPEPAPPLAADAAPEPPELPDPDTLEDPAAVRQFMQDGVPPELRRRALRRLWRMDPIYNRLDGLDDYCEDYTDQARVVKDLRTAYRVGRGFLERIEEIAERTEVAADAPPVDAEAPGPAHGADAAPASEAASEPAAGRPDPVSRAGERPRPLPRRG